MSSDNKIKIVFFGTPDFSVICLNKILDEGYEVLAVVTSPDSQKGRGKRLSASPVKELANKKKIAVLQPEKFKDPNFVATLTNFNADLFVVVAFKILPSVIFNIPRLGALNLHGSILPKFRGAAPIQWALITGEKKTGVTTFKLAEKVDTGSVYLKRELCINDDDDFGSLHDKLAQVGSEVLIDTFKLLESGVYTLEKQLDNEASPAPKITKDTCLINWSKSAFEIHNLIRGLSPFPGAYFVLNNIQYKVFKTKVIYKTNSDSGKIEQTKSTLVVDCGVNSLEILEIQQEGRRRMSIQEFLRGSSFLG